MSVERDLLGKWHNGDLLPEEYMQLMKETKELLAQPKQEPKFNFDLERMKAAIESPISDVTVDDLAKQVKQEPVVIDENTSDGYHTFKELYEFRKAYNVALFNEWGATGKCYTHKSWRHHDGELCFGGGWFIVVAVLPQGQISNHYEAKDWDLFSIQEVEKALFEFDGHTGADVVERLKLYTAPPVKHEQEPVAWMWEEEGDEGCVETTIDINKPRVNMYRENIRPLYIAPPVKSEHIEDKLAMFAPVGYLYKQMDCYGEWATIFKVDKPYITWHDIKDIVPL